MSTTDDDNNSDDTIHSNNSVRTDLTIGSDYQVRPRKIKPKKEDNDDILNQMDPEEIEMQRLAKNKINHNKRNRKMKKQNNALEKCNEQDDIDILHERNEYGFIGFENKLVDLFKRIEGTHCKTWNQFLLYSANPDSNFSFDNRTWFELTDMIDFYHSNYSKSVNIKPDFIHLYNYGGNYYDYMRILFRGETHWFAMNLVKVRYNHWKSEDLLDDDDDDEYDVPFVQQCILQKKRNTHKSK